MADLTTTYMGLNLKNPIVPSASPLSRSIDDIKSLADTGAPAVVLYSLFEEQFELDPEELEHLISEGAQSLTDALSYFPDQQEYIRNPDGYVEHVRRAKEAVDIPIIASMNGTSKGGWLDYSARIEEAGADALELNIYFIPTTDLLFGLDVETLYLDILKSVKKRLSIPVAVKLSPFFSALPNFVDRLVDTGADGVVLFNRFYQPNIDVAERRFKSALTLSTSADLLLPLRWIAILYGQVDTSMALTSGVHSAEDVLKAIMAGADIANVCSVLLKEGIGKLDELLQDVDDLMEEQGIESIEQVKGSLSLQDYVEPAALERGSYVKLLHSYGRI